MMMVEEGKLRLNDPVSRYIPEFREHEGRRRAAGRRRTRRAARRPTAAAAVLHRPGAARDHDQGSADARLGPRQRPDGQQRHRQGGAQGRRDARRTTSRASVARRSSSSRGRAGPTARAPASRRWAASIEIASGMPLDRFFRTRIFDPLGMKDITFWPTDAQMAARGDRLRPQRQRPDEDAMPNDTMSRNVYFRGSGGLYSTAEDYIPLGMMLANGGELNGKRLLSRKTVEMMTRGARPRHAARPSRRRRLRPERARRHQSRRARHDAVRRHLRLVRRAGHALLRRSEGRAGRRPDGADVESRN